MKAMSVIPGQPGSAVAEERPGPPESDGTILVDGLLVGICGTDLEVVHGAGALPEGQDRIVLGHESLGRVVAAPPGTGLAEGDLVTGIVRRPDPVPCPACAANEWDFCQNGQYTERGITRRDGYGASQWRIEPEFAVRVPAGLGDLGVLIEPASIVAKAWEQTERIAARGPAPRRVALVTGAGPIGLLAALLGVQRGYEVHVLDQVTSGPKPQLVADLGATYHHDGWAGLDLQPGVIIECTGIGEMAFGLAGTLSPAGVLCLAGLSAGHSGGNLDLDGINATLVLRNSVVFGTVNSAKRHYLQAVDALCQADHAWLQGLITRRVPLSRWPDALDRQPNDVKVAVDLTD